MPYLTRLTLDPRHPEVFRALGDSHALHRLVYLGFPDAEEGGAGRPLYRLDPALPPRRERPVVLIQSAEPPPHARRWAEKPFLTVEGPKEFRLDHVSAGQLFRFRLCANPTRRVMNLVQQDAAGKAVGVTRLARERQAGNGATRREGQRLGLYTEAEQLEWLARKALQAGFEVVEVEIVPVPASATQARMPDVSIRTGRLEGVRQGGHCDRSPAGASPRGLQHVSVTFDGVLRVTSPEDLREAVAQGIGSAKGFGFGLLSLAPARKDLP